MYVVNIVIKSYEGFVAADRTLHPSYYGHDGRCYYKKRQVSHYVPDKWLADNRVERNRV